MPQEGALRGQMHQVQERRCIKKLATVLATFILERVLAFNTRFDSGKIYNGFDSHSGHDSHNKFSVLGQVGKGLIFPDNLLLADASMVFHLQHCRHTGCRERACLNNLHGCRQPSGWNSSVRKICGGHLETQQSPCGSVSEVKNVFATIPADYSDYTNVFPFDWCYPRHQHQ